MFISLLLLTQDLFCLVALTHSWGNYPRVRKLRSNLTFLVFKMYLEHSSYLIPYHDFHGTPCWPLFPGGQRQEVVGWRSGDAEGKAGGVSARRGPGPCGDRETWHTRGALNTACAVIQPPFLGLFLSSLLSLASWSRLSVRSRQPGTKRSVFYYSKLIHAFSGVYILF